MVCEQGFCPSFMEGRNLISFIGKNLCIKANQIDFQADVLEQVINKERKQIVLDAVSKFQDAYLEKLKNQTADEIESEENANRYSDFRMSLEKMSLAEIDERYDEAQAHTMTATPNADGYIDFTHVEDDVTCGMGGDIQSLIPDDRNYAIPDIFEDENGICGFDLIERNADGSFTYREYQVK